MTGIRLPIDELRVGFDSAEKQAGTAFAAEIAMRIGNPETLAIYANEEKTLVYVHQAGDEPGGLTTIPATNIPKNKLTYDQPILVKPTPYKTFRFVALDDSEDVIYSQGDTLQPDATPVLAQQIRWGTIQPTGSLSLLITAAQYGELWVPDFVTDEFDGTVEDTLSNPVVAPTNNNRVIFVLIQIDQETGIFSFKQSSEYNASVSFEIALSTLLVPTIDTGMTQIGFVRLIAGIPSFGYGDIFNTPPWIGGSSGTEGEWEVTLTADKILVANKQIVLDTITVPTGITLTIESTAIMKVI